MSVSLFPFFCRGLLARVTKLTRTRRFRETKKNPRSFRQISIYDLGNFEQRTQISFKNKNLFKNDLEIKKELNPNLLSIRFGDNNLAYYLDSDKGFIYDMHDFFSGHFDKYDLKRLFVALGLFFRSEKSPFSRSILRSKDESGRFTKHESQD